MVEINLLPKQSDKPEQLVFMYLNGALNKVIAATGSVHPQGNTRMAMKVLKKRYQKGTIHLLAPLTPNCPKNRVTSWL